MFALLLTALVAGGLLLAGCAPASSAQQPPVVGEPASTAGNVVDPTAVPPTAVATADESAGVGTAVAFGSLSLVVPPQVAAHMEPIAFQNGAGVRFLSVYGQSPAPVNDQALFYQFQGVSRDGASYIVAIFPVTAPLLAEIGGTAVPEMGDPGADWAGYYGAVADLLQRAAPDAFVPSLAQLDVLIASMQIAP